VNILQLERKYNKSISFTSENFQHLESKAYIKENLADILLRGEGINDTISKYFKQKKKKRCFTQI
jgi:hypothetical protein